MAWQEPKTDWTSQNAVTKDDLNRIEGNIKQEAQDLQTHADPATHVEKDGTLQENLNAELFQGLTPNDFVPNTKIELIADIPGTIQTPTLNSSGQIATITHKDISNNTVRTDTFTYTTTLITETRQLSSGESLTLKYYFIGGKYNRTEVT